MTENIKNIIKPLLRSAVKLPPTKVIEIVSVSPFEYPKSYLEIIELINGQEGEIGTDSWLCLFPLEELNEVNSNYQLLMDQIPEYFLFGKDAADTGYAFHKFQGTFHSFGLMSDFKTDSIDFMGNNFYEFLEALYNFRCKS